MRPALDSTYSRRAAVLLCAGALASTLGCSSGKAEAPAATTMVAVAPSSVATSVKPTTPRPERAGLDAPVVWTQGAPQANTGMCTKDYDMLTVTEIRADRDRLYLDLVHKAVSPEQDHGDTPTGARLLVNGCPAKQTPRVTGRVWRDWESASTSSFALADLPDGDLDLSLLAFGQEHVVVLQKTGSTVKRIRDDERAGVQFIPAEKEHGIPAAIAYPMPSCGNEEVAQ